MNSILYRRGKQEQSITQKRIIYKRVTWTAQHIIQNRITSASAAQCTEKDNISNTVYRRG